VLNHFNCFGQRVSRFSFLVSGFSFGHPRLVGCPPGFRAAKTLFHPERALSSRACEGP
jgi:hypothetical protein